MEAIERLERKIDELRTAFLFQKSILTLKEASEYTGLSLSYLYKLTHTNSIAHSKPTGKKIYFEREKLDAFMKNGAVKTISELEEEVYSHANRNRRKR
ncbi:MAG TPA: helix-turn-helix domain-containing protein [Brumimicrobium sp.]|jgi:excisionase family DNA binding protein|nr:helix-turn-helix domain-containing protein [Brumimicrobium sp.]